MWANHATTTIRFLDFMVGAIIFFLFFLVTVDGKKDDDSPTPPISLGTRWAHHNFSNHSRTYDEAHKLWIETVKLPFSIATHVAILREHAHCKLEPSKESGSSIINIAVGRTGSGTLKQSFLRNELPGHHATLCTALDVQNLGYDAIVITIRDPVARLLSGYQRRAEGTTLKKTENLMFYNAFTKDRNVNHYVDALRDVTHPLHVSALELTYGVKTQSYMMSLSEYYLLVDPRLHLKVYFLCTPTLSVDFKKLAEYYKWPVPTAAGDLYEEQLKASANNKRRLLASGDGRNLGSVSGTKSEVAAQHLSEVNAKWFHQIYEMDTLLNKRYCMSPADSKGLRLMQAPVDIDRLRLEVSQMNITQK